MHKIWKKLNEGWVGTIFQIILGILIAYLTYKFLGLLLNTPTPLVAVVSTSMQHENEEITHYAWLESKFGYNRSYVNSWPIAKGFSKGDMPIVVGSKNYEIGDVIVYKVNRIPHPIIHRIVAINEDGSYQTKGDNNLSQLTYEYKVIKSQIYGKVMFVIPKLGWFKILVSEILGI
jgi:signal peptidase I